MLSFSAWTATICARSLARRIPSSSVASSAIGKSSVPLSHRYAWKPITPQSVRSCMCTRLSGVSPPHSPKSTSELALPKFHFARNPPRSNTGGEQCSGMSRYVVVPPAASARVPLSKPSQSVRPGSLK